MTENLEEKPVDKHRSSQKQTNHFGRFPINLTLLLKNQFDGSQVLAGGKMTSLHIPEFAISRCVSKFPNAICTIWVEPIQRFEKSNRICLSRPSQVRYCCGCCSPHTNPHTPGQLCLHSTFVDLDSSQTIKDGAFWLSSSIPFLFGS